MSKSPFKRLPEPTLTVEEIRTRHIQWFADLFDGLIQLPQTELKRLHQIVDEQIGIYCDQTGDEIMDVHYLWGGIFGLLHTLEELDRTSNRGSKP